MATRFDWIREQQGYETAILATFARATAAQIVDGKNWYGDAIATLAELAPAWSQAHRAAVCAILSPRQSWQTNVAGVRKFAHACRYAAQLAPTVAGVRRNVRKAWDTAQDGDTARVSGPKVSAFYANLCGDFQRVTVDTWAARAAGVPEENHNHLDGHRYATLERAYQRVAAQVGFAPAELQAIVWIVVRGHGDGTIGGTNQARWEA